MKRPAAPPAFCPRFLLHEPNKSKHNTDFHEKSEALQIKQFNAQEQEKVYMVVTASRELESKEGNSNFVA